VSRLSADDLEKLREREAASGRVSGGRAAAEARRERVARSRQAKAERKVEEEHDHDHEHDHAETDEDVVVEAVADEAVETDGKED
jgi:hypothetical protein